MTTLICGSLAFDNIMVFPDRFKNHILPEQIHILNVAFLVPELRREFGGCAGNIAYNLLLLGGEPLIMATVGDDAAPYLDRLDKLGLPRTHVRHVPGGFASEPARHAVWPFVLVAGLLLLVLAGQLFYHFRTGLVQRLPAAAALYELAGVDIPLAQNANLVAIETSDLQSDNARGLFVLNATLHNRADYAQAWPALELTLTDTSDTVVSRRVMSAAEYLPPGISPERFPANGEVAVRLWIEARNIGAVGYRLYIFYP